MLQSFEDLVEVPSSEDVETFVAHQDQKREELHFKVRILCALFLDVRIYFQVWQLC